MASLATCLLTDWLIHWSEIDPQTTAETHYLIILIMFQGAGQPLVVPFLTPVKKLIPIIRSQNSHFQLCWLPLRRSRWAKVSDPSPRVRRRLICAERFFLRSTRMPLPVLRPRGEFLGVLFKLDLSAQDRGRGSCRDGNLINYQVSEQKYRTVQ